MKLIFCPNCRDVSKIPDDGTTIFCECEMSHGRRTGEENHVEVSAVTVVIGVPDPGFLAAVANRPESGRGTIFQSFVTPKNCTTVHVVTE